MASGATTTKSASVPAPVPSGSQFSTSNSGQPIFRIYASADSWVSIGTAPDATNGTRFLVPATTTYDVFVKPGDFLAWIAA
jgi:hypothetical protein